MKLYFTPRDFEEFCPEDPKEEFEIEFLKYLIKKTSEKERILIEDRNKLSSSLKLFGAIVDVLNKYSPDSECTVDYDSVIGTDLVMTITSDYIPFDEDDIEKIRSLDRNLITSIDVSARVDEKFELMIGISGVRKEIHT